MELQSGSGRIDKVLGFAAKARQWATLECAEAGLMNGANRLRGAEKGDAKKRRKKDGAGT